MEKNADIDKALKNFKDSQTKYAKLERYYRGEHDLAFASAKFKNAFGALFREFALNLCPAVVDAVKDKLKIKEFRIEAVGNANSGATATGNLADETWRLWQANRMGTRAGEVHKEAAKMGDAYVMVWVDPQKRVTLYPQKAGTCTVIYDEEVPGKIRFAAKQWQTVDKYVRLNLFYPDRTEKYISKEKSEGVLPENSTRFVEFTLEGDYTVENQYGVVPIFHFANNADVGSGGMSELDAAIPVQDALNKSVLDMLVAMEFASYRQRWASGIEIDYDEDGKPIPPFTAGIERLWLTENPEAKFGDFEAANLEQFLKIKADFRLDIASVTGTPLYYFILTGANFPSGEALQKSETRFISKVRDRMESFGQIWEDVMAFALLMDNKAAGDTRLFTEWHDPAPLSEKEKLGNIAIKKESLGISAQQALTEAGYGAADIERIMQENQAQTDDEINAFNAGEI